MRRHVRAFNSLLGALLVYLVRWAGLGSLLWMAPVSLDRRLRWARHVFRGRRGRTAAEERVAQLDGWAIHLLGLWASTWGRSRASWFLLVQVYPWRQARNAWRDEAKCGRLIELEHHVPRLTQFLENWAWRLKRPSAYGFLERVAPAWQSDYYLNELYLDPYGHRAALYLPYLTLVAGYLGEQGGAATGTGDLTDDKLLFERICAGEGLSTVRSVFEYFDGTEYRLDEDRSSDLPRADLFSKPVFGEKGQGVERWIFEEGGTYLDDSGRRLSDAELRAHLCEKSTEEPYLLQRRVFNHRAVMELTGETLATLRIVTVRHGASDARILISVLRMGCGEGILDNLSQGGIVCGVEAKRGRLGRAIADPLGDRRVIQFHPDTRTRIAGFEIPWWHEALELCIRAHKAFPAFPILGWDVATTDEGPVLIEANIAPGVSTLEAVAGPIGLSDGLDDCLSHLEDVRVLLPLVTRRQKPLALISR